MLKVYAEATSGRGTGSQNRVGTENNAKLGPSSTQRRGAESMGNYIRRQGGSLFGPISGNQRGSYAGTRRSR